MSELELRRASLPSGEIAYADEGDGPPVLLLHGFPTSSHLWRDLLPMLSVRFRAIAPDLLGYGASEKRPDASLRIPDLARSVRELLDRLEVTTFAVVGHDIGGGIAQILALEGGVEAFAVLDGVTIDTRQSQPLLRLQSASESAADADFAEGVVRGTLGLGMQHQERLSEQDIAVYVAPWREDPKGLLRAAKALDLTGLEGKREELAELDIPAFLLWGEEDPFLPASLGEGLWDLLPNAGFALLPGCGHYVTEDAADTVLPLVAQFLRNRYLGEAGHDHAHDGPVAVDLGISFTRPPHPGPELVDE